MRQSETIWELAAEATSVPSVVSMFTRWESVFANKSRRISPIFADI